MKSTSPLRPIRRAVGESVAHLKNLIGQDNKLDRPDNVRALRYENLEERRVLSVNGVEGDTGGDAAYVTSDFNDSDRGFLQDEILRVNVLVNGEVRTLTAANNMLELTAGDQIEVVGIDYRADETTGVFAAEGYLSKINDLSSASMVDYNDGRFSGGDRDALANGSYGTVKGLANEWVVESGWDRMTINLMHYDVDSTEVGARFFAQLQVGQPDFEFDTNVLDSILDQKITAGDQVTIPAKWINNQAGNFHNYAEVDIYNASDPETIIWAGATVGNASADHSIGGEFVNTRDDDPFTEYWTPEESGEYILKYYLDPEKVAQESNEDNNRYEIRVQVAKPTPIAVDDTFESGPSLNLVHNDIPTHSGEVVYANDFEKGELAWTVNPYKTDTASSGIWEATDPVGTAWNGVTLQLEDAASGQRALVTGGHDDGSVGYDDVDNGVTSALSESLLVPADDGVKLTFKYNFANLSNSSTEDYFRVTVVGEAESKIVLEERGKAEDREGQWVEFSAGLSEFAGQSVQILVEAADLGSRSLVEAGIDDVKIEVPATPIWINDFTQAKHGTVTLNEDGTVNYTPDAGFDGEDRFEYTITDGEEVSNVAVVTVQVDGKEFSVGSSAYGNEDSAIELEIATEFEKVLVAGVPEGATLSAGDEVGNGVFELDAKELEGLTLTPVANSDLDFQLTVLPGDNGEFDKSLAQTIDVVVNAVVDGGDLDFQDFGIVTGKSGRMPMSGGFFDLDGSESHVITLNGLPEFVTLSAGTFDGVAWVLNASELEKLQIDADIVSDTSDWEEYKNNRVFKTFKIQFAIESFEENGTESTFESGSFELFAVQKTK